MTTPVRVGVIGTGIGVAHIEALQQIPDVTVTGICSARLSRAETVAARFKIPYATADYRDLLKQDIDAVVIATPPALHLAMGTDAFAAGKHVFCEKPLALTLDEARILRDAAHASGVIHMINHHLRFGQSFVQVKQLLDQGYLGHLTFTDVRSSMNPVGYLHSPLWSDSKAAWFTDASQMGGLLAGSAGPHLADLLLWYGGPIAEVATRTAVTRPEVTMGDGQVVKNINSEDAFITVVRFADNGLATMRGVPIAYRYQEGGGFSLELHGTKGGLLLDRGVLHGATDAEHLPTPLNLPGGMPQDRIGIATRFIKAIRDGGPTPAPSFDEGFAAQAVLEASLAAAQTNTWVTVATE